jgi:hypothetical protein
MVHRSRRTRGAVKELAKSIVDEVMREKLQITAFAERKNPPAVILGRRGV